MIHVLPADTGSYKKQKQLKPVYKPGKNSRRQSRKINPAKTAEDKAGV
jgi:hypothetical protein